MSAMDDRPTCSGLWVAGSGGHRVHEPCGEPADWWHPDDTFAYCATHLPRVDDEWLAWPDEEAREYT